MRVWVSATLVAVGLVASCAPETPATLVEGDAERYEARRRRMNITVVVSGSPATRTPAEFEADARHHCETEVRSLDGPFFLCANVQPQSCLDDRCNAYVAACMAHLYLELSRSAAPVTVEGVAGPLTVPPQSTATNAGFDEGAITSATEMVTLAGEALRAASDATYGGSQCTAAHMTEAIKNENDDMVPWGEVLASLLVEGTHLAETAAQQALQDNAAVADSDLVATADRAMAARDAWFAPVLSRAHGVQLIMGGSGYYDDPTAPTQYVSLELTGVCSAQCDTPACKRGLDIIESSGISGIDIVNTAIPVESLVTGTGLAHPGGLQDRLAERLQAEELAYIDWPDFLARFDVTPLDLQQARRHLSQQGAYHGRPLELEIPAPVLPTSMPGVPQVSQFDHFSFSAIEPTQPPPMHHVSMVNASVEQVDDRPFPSTTPAAESADPSPTYAERGVLPLLDYAQSVAMWVTSRNTLSAPVNDTVGTLMVHRIMTDTVRLETCYRNFTGMGGFGHELRLRVHGMDDENMVRVVNGPEGLQCGTTGLVEGQPCNLDNYSAWPSSSSHANHTDLGVGFDRYAELRMVAPNPSPVRWYVMRMRAGAPSAAAGNWEAIGSVGMEQSDYSATSAENWLYCNMEPFDSGFVQMAATFMGTPEDHCGAPRTDCYGAPLGPLPLEDELIDDGDPYETSWRHHLVVAREAATHADDLGDRLISSGLRMDERAELSLSQLEAQCGVTLNLDGLFTAMGVGGARDLGRITEPATGCPGACTCPAGYQLVGSACILDVLAQSALTNEDAIRLAECLGEDTLVPVVGLGSSEICYWRRTNAPNILCEGASATNPCPTVRREGAPCPAAPANNTMAWVAEADLLGLFSHESSAGVLTGGSYTEPLDCGLIRTARRSSSTETARRNAYDQIVNSNFFAIENVKRWAARIGWHATALDYSYLTLDGSRWYGTGNPFPRYGDTRGDDFWPCDTDYRSTMLVPAPDCTGDTESLFCMTPIANCDANTQAGREARAAVNERLARAALLVGITSAQGLANFRLPTRYGSIDSHVAENLEDYRGRNLIPDDLGSQWRIATRVDYSGAEFSGLLAVPLTDPNQVVWTRLAETGRPRVDALSTEGVPVAFLNPGTCIQEPDDAENIATAFWSGMSQGCSRAQIHRG